MVRPEPDNRRRIARTSNILRHLCAVLIAVAVVGPAVFWGLVPEGSDMIRTQGYAITLTPLTRTLAFITTLVPGVFVIWAFVVLRRLFTLYRDGDYFGRGNVACFRQLGWTAIGWTAAKFVHGGMLSVALTINNAPGERALTLSAGSGDLTALFAGIVLLLISWVMDEARRLDEEQAQIV